MIMSYEKCVCERCDELVMVADNQPLSSCDIVSLCEMGINPDVDFVCINCLTESESDQVDAYISKVEPSKYTPAQAEELIQAASKMLQERLAK
jgi:hypothetical protein